MKTVVIISANAEWRATRELLSVREVISTPMGEWFEQDGVLYFHGGWGKISAAATAQYVIDHFQTRPAGQSWHLWRICRLH